VLVITYGVDWPSVRSGSTLIGSGVMLPSLLLSPWQQQN